MKSYKPRDLVKGDRLKLDKDKWYVAVPDKYAPKVVVEYKYQKMTISDFKSEALMFRRFRDRYWNAGSDRPQYYTLGYFEFKPDEGEDRGYR